MSVSVGPGVGLLARSARIPLALCFNVGSPLELPVSQPSHIDEFYFITGEVLNTLYAGFPNRQLLLVEDLRGPIQWDITGLPDRKSKACFETLIWLVDCGLLTYRTLEPRDIGLEGAVLTQRAFVLLMSPIQWDDGVKVSRIDALREARRNRAYDDLAVLLQDLFSANCRWSAPAEPPVLQRASSLDVQIDPPQTH